jgi:hypothetical protein
MTPGDEQVKVNVALQVAGIAAQVTAALRSENVDKRVELEAKLAQAQAQLEQGAAPKGLVPFVEAMRGLLRGEETLTLYADVPPSYYAVYSQVVDEIKLRQDEGELTLRQVLDEVAHNVVTVMVQGTYAQRRMMANTLLKMQRESVRRPDLVELIGFLDAARALLNDEDPAPFASRLSGPFQAKWEEILNALHG